MDTIPTETTTIHAECHRKRFSLSALIRVVVERISALSVKRRSRLTLRDLTSDQLRDIGLTPGDVRREVAKSFFWD